MTRLPARLLWSVLSIGAVLLMSLSSCSQKPVRSSDGMVGETFDRALARFGTPATDTVLTIRPGDSLYEFQNGLYTTVLDTLSQGQSADVRQATWTGEPRRAVWGVQRSSRWVIVDMLEWDSDVEF